MLFDARRARSIQRDVLLAKIRRHAESDFGRAHGFAEMRTADDFRRRMPLTTYEDYAEYVERVKRGDLGAMFGPDTRLLMFAMTSGTTGSPKYIPITRQSFKEYRRGWQAWGLDTYYDHRDLLRKKTLQLSSDWRRALTPGGTPCGNISGLAAETKPLVANPIFLLPRPVVRIHDPQAKYYVSLRIALANRRLGMIVTANPSTLIEFAQQADREREALLRDIFDGTLSEHIPVPPQLRHALRPWTARRDRGRARELEQLIEQSGGLLPREAWPELSVAAVWSGGSAGIYLPMVRKYYGEHVAIRDHGLSASEGRMTIPLEDGTSAGVLDFLHHYFEFIPEDEHGSAAPTVLEPHELEVGGKYFIVLTTSGGLYRYDIHDVVRCVGYEGEAPRIEFLNKGAHFSNITGEKLSESQVITAVQQSAARSGTEMSEFTLAPVTTNLRPHYVLLVEPPAATVSVEKLAGEVDRQLAELNCEYADKRRSGRIEPLQIRVVPAGTWADFRRKRMARGGSREQYKHPCLVGDLNFVEKLLADGAIASGSYAS